MEGAATWTPATSFTSAIISSGTPASPLVIWSAARPAIRSIVS